LEPRWCPSYSLVTSRTALAGTDSVNWGTLGPAGTVVANPFQILSTSGRSVSVSQPTQFGPFGVFEQAPPTTAGSWNGNFAPGDMLLKGGNLGMKESDPTTLNFGATAVAAGGAQIQSDYSGSFTAEVQALDASGNVLASFTEVGNSTNAADNSAIFIGISSSSANIYQIALSLTKAPSHTIGDFAINKFDFRTIEQGDPHAAEQLLPLVYDELRKLAAEKLAHEKPGQTLQATALAHEASVRPVDADKTQHWNSRGSSTILLG
jgi:hypothetical protein